MLYRTFTIAALVVVTSSALGQDPDRIRPEFRPYVGMYVPTGNHRSDFTSATTVGMQGAVELSRNAHVLATVGWAHGHSKFSGFSEELTYIWNYDIGAELNAFYELDPTLFVRPFVGLGAGARTYDYKESRTTSSTCATGYGSLGSEVQGKMLAFRLETRGYLSCFESPITGKKQTRDDVVFSMGLALHIW